MGYAGLAFSYLFIAASPWLIRRFMEGRVRHRSAALFYFGSILVTGMATGVMLALLFLRFFSGSLFAAMGEACGGIFRASQGFMASSRWNYLLVVAAAAILFSQAAFLLGGGTKLLKVTSRLKRTRIRDAFSCPALPLISRWKWARHLSLLPQEKIDAQTVGILHPRIFITQGLINAVTTEELSAVAAHEEAHRSGRDNLLLAMAKAVSLTLFYLPGPSMALGQMTQCLEKAADVKAAHASGGPVPVASALAKIVTLSRQEAGPALAFSADGTGTESIVSRLEDLIDDKQPAPRRFWPLVFASLSVTMLLMFASSAFAVTGTGQRSAFVCFTEHAQEAPAGGVCELGHPNH